MSTKSEPVMSDCNNNPINGVKGIYTWIISHRVSLGVFLAAYGAFYLSSVILSGWSVADWGKDITTYPPTSFNTVLPRSFINPLFFVSSVPNLIIGTAILCTYSIRGIGSSTVPNVREYVAILLTIFGFTYQVIGAWPPANPAAYPWEWQRQIASNGSIFAWVLYSLSLIALVIGASSLYEHSKIHNQKNIENVHLN